MPGKLTYTGLLRGSHNRVGARLSVGRKAGRNEPVLAATFPMPGATLDLDFANDRGYVKGAGIGRVMERINFTRASTGTYMRSDGTLQTAVVNEPRFDCDVPTTRTNLQVWSETGDGWQGAGTTPPTVTNSDTQLGVKCVRIDLDQTMGTSYAGCRATRSLAGFLWPTISNWYYAWSSDVMLSRPLVGTERVSFYCTGTCGFAVVNLSPANCGPYVGSFGRMSVANVQNISQDGTDYFTVFNGAFGADGVLSPLTVWVTRTHAEANGAGNPTYIPTLGSPVTVASTVSRGLLLEEGKTNYAYNSANYAAWNSYVSGTATLTRSIVTDPVYGQVVRVTKTGGAAGDRVGVNGSLVGLTTQYVASCMYKVNTGGAFAPDSTSSYPLYVDAQTGSVPSLNTTAQVLAGLPAYTVGQWSKVVLYSGTATPPNGAASSIYHFFTGPIGASMDFACFQVERNGGDGAINSGVPTSWIPTPGAASASRASDFAYLFGPDFDAVFSKQQGTLIIECDYSGGTGQRVSNRAALGVEDVGGNAYIFVIYNGSGFANSIYLMDQNSATLYFDAGKVATAAAVKQAFAWLNGDLSSQQGVAGAAYRTTPGLPDQMWRANRISIGGTRGNTSLNGRVKRLTFLPIAMQQSQMRAALGV